VIAAALPPRWWWRTPRWLRALKAPLRAPSAALVEASPNFGVGIHFSPTTPKPRPRTCGGCFRRWPATSASCLVKLGPTRPPQHAHPRRAQAEKQTAGSPRKTREIYAPARQTGWASDASSGNSKGPWPSRCWSPESYREIQGGGGQASAMRPGRTGWRSRWRAAQGSADSRGSAPTASGEAGGPSTSMASGAKSAPARRAFHEISTTWPALRILTEGTWKAVAYRPWPWCTEHLPADPGPLQATTSACPSLTGSSRCTPPVIRPPRPVEVQIRTNRNCTRCANTHRRPLELQGRRINSATGGGDTELLQLACVSWLIGSRTAGSEGQQRT